MTGRATRDQRLRVIVVGAGAAGIAAARHLHDEGARVTVLEARARIGGRIHTDTTLAPYPLELGAEYIHGENVLTWDLVKRYGLSTRDSQDEDYAYGYIRGKLFGPNGWTDTLDADWQLNLWYAAEQHLRNSAPDTSLKALISPEYPSLTPLQDPIVYQFVNNMIAPDFAAGLGRLGVYGFHEATYEDDGDGDYYIREGYSTLINRHADGLDMRLNSAVSHIAWRDGSATVRTASGETFEADRVVVTLPLGVLKAGALTFDPPLPNWKQDAIKRLGAGAVNKLILKFKRAFWKDDLSFLITTTNSQMWWRPGWGLPDEVPLLTALIEDTNQASYAAYDEETAIGTALGELTKLFETDVSPLLDTGRYINWSQDPFALMGYSYVPVGAVGLRDKLAESVGALYFAGEATSVIRPGTVHGALESGVRAASQIVT